MFLEDPKARSFPEQHEYDPDSGVIDYECVTPCTAGPRKRLFSVGERYREFCPLNKGDIIPRHFKPIKAVKEEAVEAPQEPVGDFGEESIKSARSWNDLINIGNTVVALDVDTDLSFRKAKEDLLTRYRERQAEKE